MQKLKLKNPKPVIEKNTVLAIKESDPRRFTAYIEITAPKK